MSDTFPRPLPTFVSAKRTPTELLDGWSLSIPGVSTHYLLLPDVVFDDAAFADRYVGRRLSEYCALFGRGEEYTAWEASQ